jgi:hypothetical protein
MNDVLMEAEPTRSPEHAARTGSILRLKPAHDEIARRAYAIYERSGRQPGRSLENWLQAEIELQDEAWGEGPELDPTSDGSRR